MECNSYERGGSTSICNYFANYLPNRQLAQSNNRITITFDLANRVQPIVFIHMLIELSQWTQCQKKIVPSLALGNNKVATCYSRPILDVLFWKWFPFFRAPSPNTTTHDEHVRPTCQTQQVVQECVVSPKLITREQLLRKKKLAGSTTTSPLLVCQSHRLKTCT